MRIYLLIILLIIVEASNAQEWDSLKPRLLSRQFSFTEGPASDEKGNVYFTDQPNNRIWKYDTEGKLSIFKEPAGRSNGMFFDGKGKLITCADENNQLWSIGKDGSVTVLVNDFEGHRLNGPNDVWVSKSGVIFFTDPYYQRDYWQRTKPDSLLGGMRLYCVGKDSKKAAVADADLVKPNGVVGNQEFLYVSDMGRKTIFRYRHDKSGKLSDRTAFVTDLADGMTLDEQGNLYLAGNGVTIYNPEGKKIGHIDIPEKWTANLCFGGADHKTLFITASEALYSVSMPVRGIH